MIGHIGGVCCGGGGGLASPDLPHHVGLTKRALLVNSLDSLENEKTHSLLDGSLLDVSVHMFLC